jgi:DnaA family protein
LLRAVGQHENASYFTAAQADARLHALATSDHIPYRMIAIDDVEQLGQAGQAGVFALYNRWREVASTAHAFSLALAGAQSPLAMPVREDLRTRLGWDLVFRLELLSDENRAQALRTRAHERGLELSPDVISWVLTHYERDMGRLTALVDALDRYSLERHRAITLPLLKDLLASSLPSSSSVRAR